MEARGEEADGKGMVSRKRGRVAIADAGPATPEADDVPFRVSPEKTIIPDAPAGALERTELVKRVDLVRDRLTVFVAPGGFGKTTLLADCCRRAKGSGDRVIWLSADEQDDAERVVAHLAFAAGLSWAVAESAVGSWDRTEMHHLEGLLAAIRAEERHCVLAVDELERLPETGARVIDYLIWRGPANLHLALAGRQVPRSIDVATPIAEGRGMSLGVDALRFTLPEFASYFGPNVGRERLRELWKECHGWPIATCLQRNLSKVGQGGMSDLSLNWVAARLLRGIAQDDRDFVLRAACFEWTDAEMLDEVLGTGSTERLRHLPALRGLVHKIDGGESFRVHPLIGRHAETELRLLGSDGDLHRRMALVLAARGKTVDAIRHAVRAGDAVLGASILDAAGGIRLVLKYGVKGLQDAVALLPRDVARGFPRAEVACLAAAMTGDPLADAMDHARRLLHANEEEDSLPGDRDLRDDILIVRGILLMCGCAAVGSREVQSIVGEYEQALTRAGLNPVVAGGLWYGLGLYRYELGDLDEALVATSDVREFAGVCPSLALSARILEGAILFARGDREEAETVLAQAQRTAQRRFAGHPSPELIGNAFAAETALEASRIDAATRRVPSLTQLKDVGAWLDPYTAALDVRLDLALRQDAYARALNILEDAWKFARGAHLVTLSRWLSSVRVTVLIRAGRVDEAERLWRRIGLPTEVSYGDGEPETWREREALYAARVRLLTALGDCVEAVDHGRSFAAWARDAGLARSQSLATALAMRAAWLAGDMATAREFLVENLRLFWRTGFSRALAEQAEATVAVLKELDTDDAELKTAKEAILDVVASRRDGIEGTLSAREMEILVRLSRLKDKEIARELGITDNGVRYHTKNIYRKLGVSSRREAARMARATPAPPGDGLDPDVG